MDALINDALFTDKLVIDAFRADIFCADKFIKLFLVALKFTEVPETFVVIFAPPKLNVLTPAPVSIFVVPVLVAFVNMSAFPLILSVYNNIVELASDELIVLIDVISALRVPFIIVDVSPFPIVISVAFVPPIVRILFMSESNVGV
jgi:hypothetical protein